jgi:hypothetical protein
MFIDPEWGHVTIKMSGAWPKAIAHAKRPGARLQSRHANFGEIVGRLAGMAGRFCTALDCVDTGFLADGILDQLATPSRLSATRISGVDLNSPGCATRWPPRWPWPSPRKGCR